MKYYVTVDPEKKVLTIDDSLKPNSRDQLLIDTYIKAGYTIRFKSEARTKKAKERAQKKASLDDIKTAVKPYDDLQKILDDKLKGKGKGHGVFAVKSWYENEAKKEIETREKKK